MLNDAMKCVSVKNIRLESPTASLLVAFVEVQVGEVLVQAAVRRLRDGTLRIFLPTWEDCESVLDAVELSLDLRVEVERETLAAYEQAEARQRDCQRR